MSLVLIFLCRSIYNTDFSKEMAQMSSLSVFRPLVINLYQTIKNLFIVTNDFVNFSFLKILTENTKNDSLLRKAIRLH